jgi:PLP dependent protein
VVLKKLPAYANVKVHGLMGMATLTNDRDQIRKEFRRLKNLFEKLKAMNLPYTEIKDLSMGMSADYKVALEEGSTMVRIGSALFGTRSSLHP